MIIREKDLYLYNSDELYHYGVKGMKWGRRKAKPMSEDGSRKTEKRIDKLGNAMDEYNKKSNLKNYNRMKKAYQKYDKSARKDLMRAEKDGNTKLYNSISAGRTYAHMMFDGGSRALAINETAVKAKVRMGEDYTYDIVKNNNIGGVTISVNGHKENYFYLPELDKKKK